MDSLGVDGQEYVGIVDEDIVADNE